MVVGKENKAGSLEIYLFIHWVNVVEKSIHTSEYVPHYF